MQDVLSYSLADVYQGFGGTCQKIHEPQIHTKLHNSHTKEQNPQSMNLYPHLSQGEGTSKKMAPQRNRNFREKSPISSRQLLSRLRGAQ
jgi:hypothetical protein